MRFDNTTATETRVLIVVADYIRKADGFWADVPVAVDRITATIQEYRALGDLIDDVEPLENAAVAAVYRPVSEAAQQ